MQPLSFSLNYRKRIFQLILEERNEMEYDALANELPVDAIIRKANSLNYQICHLYFIQLNNYLNKEHQR